MPEGRETESRRLLGRLRAVMAEDAAGQARLDRITQLIAEELHCDVCSIYLFRDGETLELCATEGLNPQAVHQTRMRLGEGLVGRVARKGRIINTDDAPGTRGFRYMPETGEEAYASFLGVPIQRLGEMLGVLVVQTREPRRFNADDIYGLEIVAMVLAEMTELGAFTEAGAPRPHRQSVFYRGRVGQEGVAMGQVLLHTPQILVSNPVADDVEVERRRLGAVDLGHCPVAVARQPQGRIHLPADADHHSERHAGLAGGGDHAFFDDPHAKRVFGVGHVRR